MDSKQRIANAIKVATDTKVFEMGRGVSEMAPEVFKRYFPGRKAKIIADIHTWPVLGEMVYGLFVEAGIPVEKFIIMEEEFHAEWEYIEMVDKELDGGYIAVSVGSGVINDLCKLCSHHHDQQYLTLPTAASVDGYSSFGASISYQNSKQTFSCPAPVAIIADIDVIAAAPKEMTAAGYADLAAKVPAGAEWMIADLMGTACSARCDGNGVSFKISFSPQFRTGISKDKLSQLKAQYPELYDDYVDTTESRVFKLVKSAI